MKEITSKYSIYLIGESLEGPVKIGIGGKPEKRLKQLQIGNPRWLTLYFFTSSQHADVIESWMHRKFRNYRLNGEWFDQPVSILKESLLEAISLAEKGMISVYNRAKNLRETEGKVERFCKYCSMWKALDNFHNSNIKRYSTQARCISCSSAYQRIYRERPGVRERHNQVERERKIRMRSKAENENNKQ